MTPHEALQRLGAPTGDDAPRAADLARWTGAALPAEGAAFLDARPALDQADDHPEIDGLDFAQGLPDVDAWLDQLGMDMAGRFVAATHLGGLVPAASRLWYGDFTWLMLPLEAYAPGHSGVLYYDERELGGWGATLADWVHGELTQFYEAVDGQRNAEQPEARAAFEPTPGSLCDCFWLPGADHRSPPEPVVVHEALKAAWDPQEERLIRRATRRSWLSPFVAGATDQVPLDHLPTLAEWGEAQPTLGRATPYADAMYWLLAHAALGNGPELRATVQALSDHPGEFVQALRAAAPALVDRFAEPRAALIARAARVA